MNPLSLRATGRTTRMLEEAKRLASEGRAVYVIADNITDARRLQMQCNAPKNSGIKFETAREFREFDWDNMRVMGAHPNCAFLVDHHAIEDRYHAVLKELHCYDK